MATWLITGCSSGLGRALAEVVLAHGHRAVVTARDVATISELVASYPDTAIAAQLDVTDADEVSAAVAAGLEAFGAIDVLVNNAGYAYRAAVEEAEEDAIDYLFATHFFGPVRLIKAVLPGMRERRSGSIVNISSIGVWGMPPGGAYYCAAKAGIETLSGSLLKEVGPLGIHVMAVEPGGIRTDFAGRSLTESAVSIADYDATAGVRRPGRDTNHGRQSGDPVKMAELIVAAVEAETPPSFLLLGGDAVNSYRTLTDARRDEVEEWSERSSNVAVD